MEDMIDICDIRH